MSDQQDPADAFKDQMRFEISDAWSRGAEFGEKMIRYMISLDNRGEATTTEVADLRREVAEMNRRIDAVKAAYLNTDTADYSLRLREAIANLDRCI